MKVKIKSLTWEISFLFVLFGRDLVGWWMKWKGKIIEEFFLFIKKKIKINFSAMSVGNLKKNYNGTAKYWLKNSEIIGC